MIEKSEVPQLRLDLLLRFVANDAEFNRQSIEKCKCQKAAGNENTQVISQVARNACDEQNTATGLESLTEARMLCVHADTNTSWRFAGECHFTHRFAVYEV